jgi:RING finger protein 113A
MFQTRRGISNTAKRRKTEGESDDESERKGVVDFSSRIKRKAGITGDIAELKSSVPSSPQNLPGSVENSHILVAEDAFRISGIDIERDNDQRAQYERDLEIQKRIAAGELEEGIYRGKNAYRAYITPDDERKAATSKLTGALGPNRAMAHLRTSSRFDYQMDICKDFKETGYCGFGDSCKFLHDRSNFKTGWELEREWDEQQKALVAASEKQDEVSVDESILCAFCKRVWEDCETPACTTTCKHFFCEKCFIAHSSVHCSVCGAPTHGIFNAV